jgi:hypothetical protein
MQMWLSVSDTAEYKTVASRFTEYMYPFIVITVLIKLCIVTFRLVLDMAAPSTTCSALWSYYFTPMGFADNKKRSRRKQMRILRDNLKLRIRTFHILSCPHFWRI